MSDERTTHGADPERAQRIADTQRVLAEHGMPDPNPEHVEHLRGELARRRDHLASAEGRAESADQAAFLVRYAPRRRGHTAA